MSDDLYATLHVAPDADAKEIKKAYFGLIRQFPPETHPEEFQRLRAAYEVLSDAEQRKAYDARRSEEAATNLGEELAVMMRAAREAMELREFDRARPILQGVLLQRPDAEEARDWLCICLLSLEQFDDALVQANEYVAHHPGKAAAMLLRGYALRGAQRVAEARAAFLKAAELDPLDFRPIRAVVDIDFSTKQLDESLRFIEGRLRDAPESLRLLLRMERVSLLHATGQAVTAAGELEVLEREATTDEAREQLAWFYEREAMLLFSQRRDPTAENIVRRLERLSPGRATVHFSKLATVPLEALPTESLTWLEQQRSAPQLFALPLSGVLTWTSVLLAVALVFVVVGLNAFTSTERWGSTSLVVVALVLAGLGALVGKVLQRWARAANSRLGHFYTLHPFYFAEVDDDVVRLFPLVRLSDSRATHHHTNGGYTHTAFVLGFGGTTLSFSVRSHSEAERFAQLVHECRARMFDLLHGGLLMGDPAADFCPPSALVAPLPARRAWRWLAPGAVAGAVLAVAASVVAAHRADRSAWYSALRAGTPAVRALLAADATGPNVAEAVTVLERARQEALSRLGPRQEVLARALAAAPLDKPVSIGVVFKGEVREAPLRAPPGYTLAPLSVEVSDAGRAARQRGAVAFLQRELDAVVGAGWFVVREGAGDLSLTVSYVLSPTGKAFVLKTQSQTVPLVWPDVVLEGEAKWSGAVRAFRLGPDASLRLHDRVVTAAVRQNDSVRVASTLFDETWRRLHAELAAVLGLEG